MKVFYFSSFIWLTIFQNGASLDCYRCEGFIDSESVIERCNKPNNMTTVTIECEKEEVCVTQKTLPIARELYEPVIPKIYRGCNYEGYCENQKFRSEHCSECRSNLCNSFVRPALSLSLVTFVFVLSIFNFS